ncbi:MAG TPA: PDZ domain-containing protein [Puia sp.]|nr:PDZ domain-containing protein [Puia sp.]
MKKTFLHPFALLIVFFGVPVCTLAIDTKDTRMLSQPAISRDHIAFIYAEDLWIANSDGTDPRRLTVDEGIESNPVFSPDGQWIAFNGQYDGNTDVYIIPVQGGIPKRLTWHPSADIVRGFTPDGKSVLFLSQRNEFTNRYFQLYTVPVTGGPATQLGVPNAYHACFAPDGRAIAYNPYPDQFGEWKHYRGGAISQIWQFSFAEKSMVKIPQPEGGCNDVQPAWMGNAIYFLSDRNGEFNVFGYDVSANKIKQLTDFKDFPVMNMSAGNGKIIFEQAGYLHIYDPGTSSEKKLAIGIAADLLELRPRFAKGAKYIRTADISPTGMRAVFDFRGEIVTVPAEKGDYRNITNTTAVHEKNPAWSPDGKWIAYFSDASGEYKLDIQSQDGKGEVLSFKLSGSGFYANPSWSPDAKKIAYTDNARELFLLDIASGTIKKIDADEYYTPGAFRDLLGDWSGDSKWIAYTKVTSTQFKKVLLYSLGEANSYPVTDGLSDASSPRFSRNGKYLYFFASTDAGPVINWFDQSNDDYRKSNSIYLVTLQNQTISPLAKESDEEQPKKDDSSAKTKNAGKQEESARFSPVKIDWEGIQNRILDIPVKPGNYDNLSCGNDDNIFYISYSDDGGGTLHKFSFKKRKEEEVMPMQRYIISADAKKMLYVNNGTWGITSTGEKPETGKGTIDVEAVQVKIDPSTEWPEIFDEAWRINRDYFYDPGMHGNNWATIKKKYAVFLPDLACRDDLNILIRWMCSELSVGHHRLTNLGDKLYQPQNIQGGLLGADFAIAGNRYRITKIYGGLNWNPKLRSPLTEPGVNVKTGDYILAVNGIDIAATQELYQPFENTAGKIVELTVSPTPDYKDSRVVSVVPVESEYELRNRDWVEGNLKKVTDATNGQVAYVYVPNTAGLGHDYFKRYFYPQSDRKAIIVDERFNGGGQLADYYINLLQNPYQAHWNMRYGRDLKTPSASIQGPKVMLINESAGSGGDMLPWMFRKFHVGTLVGTRTWGGLVGILGFPEFLDGGGVTAPNVGIWTKDGFVVENVGVSPDIEVEQAPSAIISGRDPQLEKAIQVAQDELKKNPPVEPTRPPYPVKVKN